MAVRKVTAAVRARRALLLVLAFLALAGWTVKFLADWHEESRLLSADLKNVLAQRKLMCFAVTRGRMVYQAACAGCHGSTGKGDRARGVPALDDDDWLYGSGAPAEIERTVTYGIRSFHPKSWNLASMPAFARAEPLPDRTFNSLTPGQIRDVIEFIAGLQGDGPEPRSAERGAEIFEGSGGCSDCHGADARGDTAIGAPNLTDRVWLYGDGAREALFNSIAYGRQGMCPSWINRLTAAEIREVSLYVFTLSHPTSAAASTD